ncbi:MAG TPA: hypothetical protein VMC42_06650 [Methanoregulaceae archaeon]|nr:hypothetical protein [Methanoregulaceae archaeon]
MSGRQIRSGSPGNLARLIFFTGIALMFIMPGWVAAQTDLSGTQPPSYTQVTVTGVTLDPGTFETGDIGTINIEVTNTGTQSVTIHRATMYDPDIQLLTTSTYDSVGAIGAGNKMNFQFTVKADVPEGIYYPVFSLEFQDVGSLRYPVKMEVNDAPVVLSVQDKPDTFVKGQKSVVTLSLSNLRTDTVKNILIHPSGQNVEIIPQDTVIDHLDPGQTANLNFNLTPSVPTAVTFAARYLNGPNTHKVNLTLPILFSLDKTQADPVISNIVVASDAGAIKITGDITNSGLQNANSVTVTTGAPAVPVDPYKIYAVGLLKPDDFSSFEITVSSDSPDSVPVVASFKDQDGNIYNRTIFADVSSVKNPKSSNTGSLIPWVIVGVLAVCVGLVIGYQYWKTRKH